MDAASDRKSAILSLSSHDDVIKWKHFPRYWPFVRGIHREPVNSPHKGQWRGAVMFSLICVWINGWVNNREAGDLRRYRTHYDVSVMICTITIVYREMPINASKQFNISTWSLTSGFLFQANPLPEQVFTQICEVVLNGTIPSGIWRSGGHTW